jgi:hypothetical protein
MAGTLRRDVNDVAAASSGSSGPYVFGEQLGRRSPTRLLLEIDIGRSLPASIADNLVSSTFQGAAEICRPSL